LPIPKANFHVRGPTIEPRICAQDAIRSKLDVVATQPLEPMNVLIVFVVVIATIVRHHDDSRTRCHSGSMSHDDMRGAQVSDL
jgi:hypothetical protein